MAVHRIPQNRPPARYAYIDFHKHLTECECRSVGDVDAKLILLSFWSGCKKNGYTIAFLEGEKNNWIIKAVDEWEEDYFEYGMAWVYSETKRIQCIRGKCFNLLFHLILLKSRFFQVYRANANKNEKEETYLSRPICLGDGYTQTDEHDALQMASISLITKIDKEKSVTIIDFDEEERKHKLKSVKTADGKTTMTPG